MNKMRILANRNNFKEPNKDSGAEKDNNWTKNTPDMSRKFDQHVIKIYFSSRHKSIKEVERESGCKEEEETENNPINNRI